MWDILAFSDTGYACCDGWRPWQRADGLPATLTDLATVALSDVGQARAVIVAPGSNIEHMLRQPEALLLNEQRWHVWTTGALGGTPDYISIRRNDISGIGRREISVYLNVDERWRFQSPALDPVALRAAFMDLEISLRVPLAASPAQTALESLRRTCDSGGRSAWLAPLAPTTFDLLRDLSPAPVAALNHVNTEPVSGSYIHVLDKRSAYLQYMASARFGSGDPVPCRTSAQSLEVIARERPALVHVTDVYEPERPEPGAPALRSTDGAWIWSHQANHALATGWRFEVGDSWCWPAVHETLQDWSRQMQLARAASSADVASMIKAAYTGAFGMFGRTPASGERTHWYTRPDWHAQVIAGHNARMSRQIILDERAHPGYLAVATDAIAWVTDDPEITWWQPRLETGRWRYLGRCDAAPVLALARDGVRAKKIFEIIGDLIAEQGV